MRITTWAPERISCSTDSHVLNQSILCTPSKITVVLLPRYNTATTEWRFKRILFHLDLPQILFLLFPTSLLSYFLFKPHGPVKQQNCLLTPQHLILLLCPGSYLSHQECFLVCEGSWAMCWWYPLSQWPAALIQLIWSADSCTLPPLPCVIISPLCVCVLDEGQVGNTEWSRLFWAQVMLL